MFDSYYIKHKKYIEQIKEDIDDAEKVLSTSGDINLKSFDLHDELNDKVWDEHQNLKPGIREQLLQIARDFYDTLDIAEITEDGDPDAKPDPTFQKYVKDVFFVGSLASFNYSSYADVDIHLLMDEEQLVGKQNKLALNILKKYFTECKNDWNLKHTDLTVEGYDCELYVQDTKEENASNGVYSLFNDEWVKRPVSLDTKNLDRAWVEKKALDYIEQIDSLEEVIQSNSDLEMVEKAKDELKKIKDKIVQGRRDSLAAGQGEMNSYNILFKILRRSGHIGKINDLTVKAYDMVNSFDNNNLKKGNDMKTDESIVKESEVDAIAEFEDMYGAEAAEALKKYLAKRSRKSAEEVLNSDDEFDKFANWAYKHLKVDVYAKFAKYDKGSFYKRTSDLVRDPEQRGDRRGSDIDDTFYSVVDGGDDDFDSATDTWKEPTKFDDSDDIEEESITVTEDGDYTPHELEIRQILNTRWSDPRDEGIDDYKYRFATSTEVRRAALVLDRALEQYAKTHNKDAFMQRMYYVVDVYCANEIPDEVVLDYAEKIMALVNVTNESIQVVEDKILEKEDYPEPEEPARKARMILGDVDGNSTFVLTSNEPREEANKVLKELGGKKWTKDKEYSYWYFTSPMKIADVQAKLKPFEETFKVEIQEANKQEENQPEQPTEQQQAEVTTEQPAQAEPAQTEQPAVEQTIEQTEQPAAEEEQPKESEATAKIVGSTWGELLDNIEAQTVYKVDSAFRRHPNQWIELIDKSGQIYDGEVTKYSDGEYELLYTNISPVPNVESKKPTPLNESYADDSIEEIKGVIRKYFEVDPETEEPSEEFDENFTAQEAIDEIVDILY